MIAAILAASLMMQPMPPITPHGIPTSGVATWYGAHHAVSRHFCYGGYRNTCSPYATGEKVYYAAVGTWKWGDKPYKVRVCLRDHSVCVVAVVRDYCLGAWQSLRKPWSSASRVIDLSPALFAALAPLSRGVVYVVISEMGVRRGY